MMERKQFPPVWAAMGIMAQPLPQVGACGHVRQMNPDLAERRIEGRFMTICVFCNLEKGQAQACHSRRSTSSDGDIAKKSNLPVFLAFFEEEVMTNGTPSSIPETSWYFILNCGIAAAECGRPVSHGKITQIDRATPQISCVVLICRRTLPRRRGLVYAERSAFGRSHPGDSQASMPLRVLPHKPAPSVSSSFQLEA